MNPIKTRYYGGSDKEKNSNQITRVPGLHKLAQHRRLPDADTGWQNLLQHGLLKRHYL